MNKLLAKFWWCGSMIALFQPQVFAGQGVQRLLYTAPNTTFVMQKSGETLVTVNDSSGSIATLQSSINNARSANPNNVIIIRLTNLTYVVSSTSLTLDSRMCLVASGATIKAVDSAVTVPLITIASGATNVSVAGGTLDGNSANINGIYAPAAKRVNVDIVTVRNCGQDCILLKGQGNSTYDTEMTVTRCELSGSPAHAGISIQNSTQAYAGDNYCHNNGQGIWLSCAWAVVANNVCINNVTGIDISGGNDNVIANNTCDNNGTGIHAGASNNMIVSNELGTNSVTGIKSDGSGNTFADNLFAPGNTSAFSSSGSGNNVIPYGTNLSASGQNYFYPPLIDHQHTDTIVNGMGRTDLTVSSTTITSVQSQYNSLRSANPNNVIVLHLNGTFAVDASPLTLESNTCVLLNGTIQMSSSTAASAAIAGGTSPRRVSISGGIIDGGNQTGNNGISIGSAALIQLDSITLRNFGAPDVRKGSSDVVHLSGGATPQIVTRCYLTNGAARGIWFQTSGIKRLVSDTEVTQVNQDGVDCDSSTSGSVVKFCYCHDLVRYGVFFEQSASHNLALGNVCNNDGRDINLYNNSTTPRGDTAYNTVICNSLQNGNALRNGSTGTNVVQTSHNFLFNNHVISASISSENYGTENYYSQNYQSSGSLSTAGTEAFFNSTDVSSSLYMLEGNSGLPALALNAAITNGTPVAIGSPSGLDNDLWALIPTDSGYYRITNKKSSLVMAVLGASLSPGASIIQWSFGSGKNDQWLPMSAGNGRYYFINRLSGLCLDVPASAPGTQLNQQNYSGGANQQFAISLNANATVQPPFFLSANPGSRTITAGGTTNYTITLATNTGFVPPVTFLLSGLPANSSANFSPLSLSGSGSTTLSLSTSNNTPLGSYLLTVAANSSAGTNTLSVSLSIVTPGSNLVWNSSSSTAWDTIALNWFNPLIGSNDVFQNGKTVSFNDGNVVTNVTLATGISVSPASVTFSADQNNYSISGAGKITGSTGLSKTGAGTLILNNTNDFTGTVVLGGGTVSTPLLANSGSASGIGAGSGSIVLDGGALQWTGGTSVSINRGFILTLNGGAIITTPPTQFNLTLSGALSYSNSGPRTLILGGTDPNPLVIGGNSLTSVITDSSGSTALEKDGNNAWNLSAANTFSGGCNINGGRLRANTSASAFGTGPVTVADGAQAYLNVGAAFPNAFFIAGIGIPETDGNYGALRLAANACNITNTLTLMNDARITARGATAGAFISGQITGDADLEFGNSGGTLGVLTLSNSLNSWSGNTIISHGTLRLGAPEAIPHGADAGNVVINNSSAVNNSVLDLSGVSPTLNALSSTGVDFARCIITNSASTAVTLTLGDNDGSGTYGGVIKDGSGAVFVVKIGSGTETLAGANTYSGSTLICNGALVINGSLGNGAVTVISGGTVGGIGTVGGALTVNPGGTVAPGTSIGVLTVNNNISLQGTTVMELNQASHTNDVLRSTGTIAYGGTLVITNLSGVLTTNDTFKLFSAVSYTGAFTLITPAPSGLSWNTNTLSTDGNLRLAAVSPPMRAVIVNVALAGTNLLFTVANGTPGAGFYVLASTNLTQPLSNWLALSSNSFNGAGIYNATNSIDPAVPTRYFAIHLVP